MEDTYLKEYLLDVLLKKQVQDLFNMFYFTYKIP